MSAEITNKNFELTDFVKNEIMTTLTFHETGGILGCEEIGVVNHFYYDVTGTSTDRNYIPDTTALNKVIADWHAQGIKFAGFVHSHSAEKPELSRLDVRYSEKIKRYCSMTEILMVIYIPEDKTFYKYVV